MKYREHYNAKYSYKMEENININRSA